MFLLGIQFIQVKQTSNQKEIEMNALEFYEAAVENAKQTDNDISVGYFYHYSENAYDNIFIPNALLYFMVDVYNAYTWADANESHVYYDIVVKNLEHIEL